MPIYHKAPPSIVGNHATSEIDNHTSEAAKVKRTREHAYFNSYDFDAIEVLPYDDDDEEEEEKEDRGKAKHYPATATTATTTTSSQQQHGKSKAHAQPISSQSRQHLQQHQPKFGYPPKQQHPFEALIHSKVPKSHSSHSDNFIVDNLPLRSTSLNQGQSQSQGQGNKHPNTYLQRFGVALFGGVNVINSNKSAAASSLQEKSSSSSSSASSTTSSTSSSLADDDDIKHLKVSSSELSSSSTTRAHTPSSITASCSSSAAAATDSLNCAPPNHRAAENNVSGMIKDAVCGGGGGVAAPTTMATSGAVVGPAAGAVVAAAATVAAATATADGNFLLPRAMLKYQSTPLNGNGGIHSATQAMSMPTTTTTTNNGVIVAATTTNSTSTNTGSSPAAATATELLTMVQSSNNSASRLKKHSTTSSSLSSLGSEEIVEIHHVDLDRDGSKTRKDFKVMPKIIGGKTPGRAASHQSHYSTDKSASSGYYSSNVCSTYSLEEHIYSEPTIELKEIPLSHKESINSVSHAATKSGSKPVEDALQLHHATLAKPGETSCSADSVMRTLDYNRRYRYTDHNVDGVVGIGVGVDVDVSQTLPAAKRSSKEFTENLRILESSIENLDRHLKSFPGVIPHSTQDAIAAYSQNPSYHGEKIRSSYSHLPTIREGYDNTAKRVWPEDPVTDDSLRDIDLDSFLLAEGTKDKKRSRLPANNKGIDNPTFLNEELEENHYKCAKYINSCPEDAYRVESDIIAPARSSISEQSVAVSLDLYPKRYEDQIHFQNTRELLEDVRDKIRLLNLTQDHPQQELAVSRKVDQQQRLALDEYIPKELNTMIGTLKRELELYLQRMNQHSELEIRQLCTGLVKNQHIVKMKNAFERRRSLTDVSDQLSTYEAMQGEMRALGGVPISIRQEVTTIKCASDPNFKMKRKSLTEVFPISECYIETLAVGPEKKDALPPLPGGGSQLQRNLNFHQPNIQQFEPQTSDVSAKSNGASSGSGSSGKTSALRTGNDSSESNDKDSILEWHRKKPSIWEMYYGTNRIQQSLLGGNGKKNGMMVTGTTTASTPSPMCYPSSRPESDFTLDLPRAEQLRIKMEKEKKFRQRCRVITTFLSLVFFLLTVMVVSLVLTRGKRMFGSMI